MQQKLRTISTTIMNAYNKKNVCTNKKWLSNRKIVADSFVTKITHYFNKNHKRLQQQKCVFTTSRKHVNHHKKTRGTKLHERPEKPCNIERNQGNNLEIHMQHRKKSREHKLVPNPTNKQNLTCDFTTMSYVF